jgi:hypothetical protein
VATFKVSIPPAQGIKDNYEQNPYNIDPKQRKAIGACQFLIIKDKSIGNHIGERMPG